MKTTNRSPNDSQGRPKTVSNDSQRQSRHLARLDWFVLTPFWSSFIIWAITAFIGRQWLIGVVLLIGAFLISLIATSLHKSLTSETLRQGRPRLKNTVVYDPQEVSFQETHAIGKALKRLLIAAGVTTLILAMHRGVAWYFAILWGWALASLAAFLSLFGFALLSAVMDKNQRKPGIAIIWGCAIGCAIVAATTGLGLLPIILVPATPSQSHAQPSEADHKLLADIHAKAENGDAQSQLELGVEYAVGLGVRRDDHEATNWLTKAFINGQPNALVFLSEVHDEPDSTCFDHQQALEFARRAANEGGAYGVLLDIYDDATSSFFDPQRAFKIARRFAEAGDAMAKAELGVKYIEGTGVVSNPTEGVRWLRQGIRSMELAANALNSPAESLSTKHTAARYANRLASYYQAGTFLPKDETNTLFWFRRAAELGDREAQVQLGYLLSAGVKMPTGWSPPTTDGMEEGAQHAEVDRKLLADIRAKAESGDAQSQTVLGEVFASGTRGVAKDEVEAAKWWRKAAEQNYAQAQFNLGLCCAEGRGVAKDEMEAVKWYQKAAEQNFAPAQYNLGVCYDQGQGVLTNYAEAVTWYRRAADQNYANAQYNLGNCYHKGQGVEKDFLAAATWYHKAAAQNVAVAQLLLGNCYYKGRGVAKDYVQAVKWYRRAAEQNNAKAQYSLGLCYAVGDGVAEDNVQGYKWLLLAAEKGNKDAKSVLTTLANEMTRWQIADGQKLARGFHPREVTPAGER